ILGRPLECTCGTLGQLPIVVVQVVQEPGAPLCRRVGPRALETAGDGVAALAAAEAVLPAEALQLEGSGLWLGPDVRSRGGGTVGLAERVAANDQRSRLLVVHRHAGERLADDPGGSQRIRLAVRA